MSVRRLSAAIADLQNKPGIDADDITVLREAAGPKVSASERSLLDSFVKENASAFSGDAAEALQVEFGMAPLPGSEVEVVATHTLDVREASGLVSLSGGRFLVIDDERGVLASDPDGSVETLLSAKKHKELRGLEGLCLSSDGKHAYALSENSRRVISMKLEQDSDSISLGTPETLGRLPKLGRAANNGWEGIDLLPGRFSPTGEDCLVAVHEGSPRRVGLFSLPDLEEIEILSPPPSALKHLSDISDVAVHPTTGHLFLLSDESSSIVEVSLSTTLSAGPGALLESTQLVTLGHFELPRGNRKPEGLTFSNENTLWVAHDGCQDLLEIHLSF